MGYDEQQLRRLSKLAIRTGQRLLQHGAESKLVVDLAQRVGRALGADAVELSLNSNSMVATVIIGDECMTTTRRCPDAGINMTVITELQQLCLQAESGKLDIDGFEQAIENLSSFKYNRHLVAVMIGLSCACFARLAGGDWAVFSLTFVASSVAMAVRQRLGLLHFNPLVNFFVTALVATSVSLLGVRYAIGNDPHIAMASSVLLLVPGVPLINAVSDMVKGYIDMGVARWVFATMLTLATSIGIIAAVGLWGGSMHV
ncbi:uncharacterized membrane protein YjjP (DUF1212 family) [Sinobacterium caligoides]|uniref:Uncharacterized membrane protein YjjP (DUF1212 family) n=2 Tax=Sinobacterium caligoides TaxID=933926 RepID=A0A3N2DZ00_9GAMM|nr:uncharacterized membrane protein YjjP (DUF1212 family) [Sinobacterium caligoides]